MTGFTITFQRRTGFEPTSANLGLVIRVRKLGKAAVIGGRAYVERVARFDEFVRILRKM
jgi:hypothetical protein